MTCNSPRPLFHEVQGSDKYSQQPDTCQSPTPKVFPVFHSMISKKNAVADDPPWIPSGCPVSYNPRSQALHSNQGIVLLCALRSLLSPCHDAFFAGPNSSRKFQNSNSSQFIVCCDWSAEPKSTSAVHHDRCHAFSAPAVGVEPQHVRVGILFGLRRVWLGVGSGHVVCSTWHDDVVVRFVVQKRV